jgi:hypothetical protein
MIEDEHGAVPLAGLNRAHEPGSARAYDDDISLDKRFIDFGHFNPAS